MVERLHKHWKLALALAVLAALYFWATRKKTNVIGVVDISGDPTVNGELANAPTLTRYIE